MSSSDEEDERLREALDTSVLSSSLYSKTEDEPVPEKDNSVSKEEPVCKDEKERKDRPKVF